MGKMFLKMVNLIVKSFSGPIQCSPIHFTQSIIDPFYTATVLNCGLAGLMGVDVLFDCMFA